MLFGVYGPNFLLVFKAYPVGNNFNFDVVLTEFLNVANPKHFMKMAGVPIYRTFFKPNMHG